MQTRKRNRRDNPDALGKNLEDRLPKNVRQIGSVGGEVRVYVQEFVLNYLKRIQKEKALTGKTSSAVLIGEKVVAQKATYFFVQGAVDVELDLSRASGRLEEEEKKNLEDRIANYFGTENSALGQIGWSSGLVAEGQVPEQYQAFHRESFGAATTIFLGFCEDGEEIFYINENGKLRRQDGYYVYFERNEGMQKYVEDHQPAKCVEMEPLEKGRMEKYRALLASHKEEIQGKRLIAFLYGASTFLVMVVIVMGVTLIRHYDRVKEMQDVIGSLSKNVISGPEQTSGTEGNGTELQTLMPSTGAGLSTNLVTEPGAGGESAITDQPEPTLPAQTEPPSISENEEEALGGQGDEDGLRSYEVKAGDTLIGICRRLYGSLEYLEAICEYNHIENSDEIQSGQKIWVP